MDRPDLFEMMLASLVQNDISGWHMFIGVEPSEKQDAFAPICERYLAPGSYTLTINPRRLGIRPNIYQVTKRAFDAGADVNLYLEEDLLLGRDVIALAEWFMETRKPHQVLLNLLAGSCGNPGYLSHVEHPDLFFETDCFNSYGFVLPRDGWEAIRGDWLGPDRRIVRRYRRKVSMAKRGRRHLVMESWAWAVFGFILSNPDLKVVQPVAARATHTGAEGFFCYPAYQEQAYGHLNLTDCAPGEAAYRVVDVLDLPDRARGHVEALHHAAALVAEVNRPDPPLKWPPLSWWARWQYRRKGHVFDPK